jgi:REP element-mobilizing transposase RayT
MPRGPRLDIKDALHHVMGRGLERRRIFLSDVDRSDFVGRLGSAVLRSGAQVYAWALMANHFHLLIRTGSLPLSNVMRRVLTGYSVTFNRRHHRVGHLFQNRYKSVLVEEDPYLLELVRYIHLNPIRSGDVPDLNELDNYCWTGHAALLGKGQNTWQDCRYVLEQFGARLGGARRSYREFVAAGIQQGKRPDLTGGGLRRSMGMVEDLRRGREKWSFDERVLGGSDFVQMVLQEVETERKDGLPVMKPGEFRDIIRTVASKLNLTVPEVVGGSRRKDIVIARNLLSYIAVRACGMGLAEVARELRVSKQTILRGIESGDEELKKRGRTISEFIYRN